MNVQTEQKNKNGLSRLGAWLFFAVLCLISAVCLIAACLTAVLALSNPHENTVYLFGYKFYVCAEEIESAEIESGSLIIIRDTDNDDFYTPQTLSENALVIPKVGSLLKQNSFILALCVAAPFELFFFILLLTQIRKALLSREEKFLECEIEFSEIEDCELEETKI